MYTKIEIGANIIEIWEDTRTIRTTFPDGVQLLASPEDTDEYRLTASELGYSDVWEMCKDHELLHTQLAVKRGEPYSRGLYRAANGLPADEADFIEEGIVIEKQRRI